MEIDYENIMARQTDEELREYIENPSSYTVEYIDAAILELQKRGHRLADDVIASTRDRAKQQSAPASYATYDWMQPDSAERPKTER